MSESIDPAQVITKVLSRVYEYLQADSRVVRPGSVRSFEAAASDIMMRILLEGGVDYDKFKETVTRIGIENLYLSVETSNPDDKKRVLEEVFERAFEDVERKHGESEEEQTIQQVAGFNAGNEGESSEGENTEESNEGSTSNIGGGFGTEYSTEENQEFMASRTMITNVDEHSKDAKLDSIISTIYEILYGGVGTVNFLNLAS